MKKYAYSAVMLMAVVVLFGCGNYKTSQKLVGTEVTSGDTGGQPLQNTIAQNSLEQITPNLLSAMAVSLPVGARPGGAGIEPALVANITKSTSTAVGGGTLDVFVTATASITATSDSSRLLYTEEITTSFSNITVTIGGKKYTVRGSETASGTLLTTSSLANGIFTSVNRISSVVRTGSLTISGPDCKGAWKYSITTDKALSLTAPAAINSTMTFTGTETIDGTVALKRWHVVIPVTETVTPIKIN